MAIHCPECRHSMDRPLTPRELEVLDWLCSGLRPERIARRMRITQGTVKIHLHGIYGKLGVSNAVEAIHRAWHLGLLGKSGANRDPGPDL